VEPISDSIHFKFTLMSLYRIAADKLEPVSRTTFAKEKLMERKDLQRLLRQDISVLGDDLMIIAEEYGDWEDCNRRIDLLCLCRDGCLVVVEIKRTEDGGHMELQAIRYAALVSSMTLDQAIAAYARNTGGDADAARNEVLEFLQLDSAEESELTGEVRIVLVAADFSTELTTAVLWLNRLELDITCIRLRPYRMGNEVIIDVTQIIPLPESADYEVKIREQEKEKRKVVTGRHELFRRFWGQLLVKSRERTQLLSGRTTTPDSLISTGMGRGGFSLCLSLTQEHGQVECFIRVGRDEQRSKQAFEALAVQKAAIEKAFGESLDWQELPGRNSCRICREVAGGWKTPEADWPDLQDRMIDALIRLDGALRKPVQELSV
jgi:hypothetical protein